MARVLLDECVDRRLAALITGHDVQTAASQRWLGISDASLLERAEREFDVLVTTDQNLRHQQNLSRFDIRVIVLRPSAAGIGGLAELVSSLLEALSSDNGAALVEIP